MVSLMLELLAGVHSYPEVRLQEQDSGASGERSSTYWNYSQI